MILGVGVRPENHLAVEAGLEVGPRGGIRVNEYLQTSDPDIFAVGDAIEVADFVTGEPTQVPLAGPANRQGRIAADNVFGRAVRYRGTQGTAIVRVFGQTAAITGASEKSLRRAKRRFRMIYVHPTHHAGYYPGAEAIALKLLFDPQTGRILGAQAVGGAGVDKRIDVLAVAIQAGMTVFDLEEMELAYAPQYGSAKDPINMAGFVAAGLLRGDHPQTDVAAVVAAPAAERPFLLDVRTPQEFAAGNIPGAVNIPVDELRSRSGRAAAGPRDRRLLSGGPAWIPRHPHPASSRFLGGQRRWWLQDLPASSGRNERRPLDRRLWQRDQGHACPNSPVSLWERVRAKGTKGTLDWFSPPRRRYRAITKARNDEKTKKQSRRGDAGAIGCELVLHRFSVLRAFAIS